jgi:hypothetical protein
VEEVVKKQTELLRRIATSEEDSAYIQELIDAHKSVEKTTQVAVLPLPIPTPAGMVAHIPIPLPYPLAGSLSNPMSLPRLQTLEAIALS